MIVSVEMSERDGVRDVARPVLPSMGMEPSPGLVRFREVVSRDDIALDHAALLIGAWDYPERDVDAYRNQLDRIATFCAPEVSRAPSGIGRARAISDCLFERLGFC